MPIINEGYELVPVESLEPHPENPRQGDVGAIAVSIEVNGFYGAVVAQTSTRRIIAGNHRWLAARARDEDQVPVIWVDVDDETARRILLADNRTNDLAAYDDEALARLLTELARGPGLEGSGYDGDDLDDLLATLEEADGFEPVDDDEQPRLDRRKPVTCPGCGLEFVPGETGDGS